MLSLRRSHVPPPHTVGAVALLAALIGVGVYTKKPHMTASQQAVAGEAQGGVTLSAPAQRANAASKIEIHLDLEKDLERAGSAPATKGPSQVKAAEEKAAAAAAKQAAVAKAAEEKAAAAAAEQDAAAKAAEEKAAAAAAAKQAAAAKAAEEKTAAVAAKQAAAAKAAEEKAAAAAAKQAAAAKAAEEKTAAAAAKQAAAAKAAEEKAAAVVAKQAAVAKAAEEKAAAAAAKESATAEAAAKKASAEQAAVNEVFVGKQVATWLTERCGVNASDAKLYADALAQLGIDKPTDLQMVDGDDVPWPSVIKPVHRKKIQAAAASP